VHNNMVYGLTKGQASPTSQIGMRTPFQVDGVSETPLNPLALAISLDAGFVARGAVGEAAKTREMIKAAIRHKGFSLVDIFQACVSFNKINTHQWFKEHTKLIDPAHDPHNRSEAFRLSLESDPFLLGVFYENDTHAVFGDTLRPYKTDKEPLYTRKVEPRHVDELLARKK
jgi:2-oxoglutarate/2-oxoacid ferredoxin oxidoreductase subunit beta